MRQAGIIAAAGVYALDNMVERLVEDHDNAQRLAKGLASIPGIEIDPERGPDEHSLLQRRPGPFGRTGLAH